MIRRIFVTVGRGITDATAVCVFPWELSILERIHGGSVVETSIDKMCDLQGAVRVQKNAYKRLDNVESEPPPNLRQQLEAMATVHPDEDPTEDPDTEYNRLAEKYGMDKEVSMPVVSVVYGQLSSGAFQDALRAARERAEEDAREATANGVPRPKSVEEMTINELRTALRKVGIDFDPKATKVQLADQLVTAVA